MFIPPIWQKQKAARGSNKIRSITFPNECVPLAHRAMRPHRTDEYKRHEDTLKQVAGETDQLIIMGELQGDASLCTVL